MMELQLEAGHCDGASTAEGDAPVSELCPRGGAAPQESSLSDRPTSSTEATKSSMLTTQNEESTHRYLEEASSEKQLEDISVSTGPCAVPSPSRSPSAPPETQPETASQRTGNEMNQPSLPVHRSHSDTLAVQQNFDTQAQNSEFYEGESVQETFTMLACKQPIQLQQCNIITMINRGEGGVAPPQGSHVCTSPSKAAVKAQCAMNNPPPQCEKAICYGSYVQKTHFEDTFAAYCHPQPITAPSQLLPRLASLQSHCNSQRAVAPPAGAASHLSLPRLISSVSETGLDDKHLLCCCNLNCMWISTLPPGPAPQCPKPRVCCGGPTGQVRIGTRDMGTMTMHRILKDVGVQTSQTISCHVFPQICLTEDSKSETSATKTPDSDRNKTHSDVPKSPIKEVKWDAEGMTWEVYGASVDPEELGLAIQKHLELQIKETSSRAAKLSRQNTSSSKQTGSRRKRSRLMGSFQTPGCCSRRSAAVD